MQNEEIFIRPERLKPLVAGNVTYRSMYDFRLTERDLEQAFLELGETEEKKNASLEKLKKMLAEHKTFQYRTDDAYLLRYLRCKKFECSRAYSMVKSFYGMRMKDSTLPQNLEFLLNLGVVKCFPYRDENGSIIIWIDTRKWNLAEMSVCTMLDVSHIIYDILSMNPSSQVNSILTLWDLAGITPRHLAQIFTPSTVKTMLQSLQNCHPFRIKRIICFNTNSILRVLHNGVISRMSKKIADRMKLLKSDVIEIHKYINPAILPKDYGGTIEESECTITDFILDNLKYLEYEHSFWSPRNDE